MTLSFECLEVANERDYQRRHRKWLIDLGRMVLRSLWIVSDDVSVLETQRDFFERNAEAAEAEVERLQNDLADALDWKEGGGPTVFDMLQRKAAYQRRHRKWALKEAKGNWHAIDVLKEMCGIKDDKYFDATDRAETAEAKRDKWRLEFGASQKAQESLAKLYDKTLHERDKLAERVRVLDEVLDWLTHVVCGCGKGGGSPEPGEFEAVVDAARAALSESSTKMEEER